MTQETSPRPRRRRMSPDELEARTRAVLILTLAGVLGFSVIALLYSLIFVYQPAEQSPNDAAFLGILEPLMFSIGGALTGLAAGGAMARRNDDDGQ
jgi:hypothetical protein